ncbi:hypothetical protein OYC64_019321 [Pagothenia borchgrevinki]|uniref:HAT C-terminal dimerisation domain-containing protein n=1 Tax=Pagothenia borchgrevinki TaxID=8213 RepID=A0ABD2GS63_PAGBO
MGFFQGTSRHWSSQEQDTTGHIVRPSSNYEEFGVLYPTVSQLAACALTVPVSSVNCERDFSTLNRVKTNICNRLQGRDGYR